MDKSLETHKPFAREFHLRLIRSLLRAIGEDSSREGLLKTPERVVDSWKELFAGYGQDLENFNTVFEQVGEYDEIVLLRNIEFYSFCEHHMLPFSGVGHVAYLPNKQVIGISKLARILDMYSKRLQIQERIGQQVVAAIDSILKPQGSACILVAQHACMRCRGVQKQASEMVTSSLTGVFKKKAAIRSELLSLIGNV